MARIADDMSLSLWAVFPKRLSFSADAVVKSGFDRRHKLVWTRVFGKVYLNDRKYL